MSGDPLVFYEVRCIGKWWPRSCPAPLSTVTRDGRTFENHAETVGPEVRNVVEVRARHRHLSLHELAELYGARSSTELVAAEKIKEGQPVEVDKWGRVFRAGDLSPA